MLHDDDKKDEVECEDIANGGIEEKMVLPPGDVVLGRLHWQCFPDGRVGLALLRSPKTHSDLASLLLILGGGWGEGEHQVTFCKLFTPQLSSSFEFCI